MEAYFFDAFLPAAEQSATYVLPIAPGEVAATEFEVVELGQLHLPAGVLCAADAWMGDGEPEAGQLAVALEPGRYPVALALVRYEGRYAASLARVALTAAEPVDWEPALLPDGQEASYLTDTGTGGFCTPAGWRSLQAWRSDPAHAEALAQRFEASGKGEAKWLLWEHAEHTVALFTCGGGESRFPTYLGYDDQGKLCQVLTDLRFPVEDADDWLDGEEDEEDWEDEEEAPAAGR
jgi:hypothetical protein